MQDGAELADQLFFAHVGVAARAAMSRAVVVHVLALLGLRSAANDDLGDARVERVVDDFVRVVRAGDPSSVHNSEPALIARGFHATNLRGIAAGSCYGFELVAAREAAFDHLDGNGPAVA